MFYMIFGKVRVKREGYVVVENQGFGFKIFVNESTFRKIPSTGGAVSLFTFFYPRENQHEFYGFLDEPSLFLFELLKSVSGVGPKSGLSLLDIDSVQNVTAAILEKKTEILTRASGIGKKTAERIIIELQNKLELSRSSDAARALGRDVELEDVLVGLGYNRSDARNAVREIPKKDKRPFEDDLRDALKIISRKK